MRVKGTLCCFSTRSLKNGTISFACQRKRNIALVSCNLAPIRLLKSVKTFFGGNKVTCTGYEDSPEDSHAVARALLPCHLRP